MTFLLALRRSSDALARGRLYNYGGNPRKMSYTTDKIRQWFSDSTFIVTCLTKTKNVI
jgi:hypothetical protein